MAADFDPYYVWLGIPPEEQPANHYRLLSLKLFESNADVIDNAADRQMAHLRTQQTGKHAGLSQRLLNELAAVRICLLDPQKRVAYDHQLRAKLAATRGGAQITAPSDSAVQLQSRRTTGQQPIAPVAIQAVAATPRMAAIRPSADQWDQLLGDSVGPSTKLNARKRGGNRGLLYGVVAAVAVAAVGIGILATSNSTPANGTLVFDAMAVGDAVVTLDNNRIAVPSNGRLDCSPGTHSIVGRRPAYKFADDVTVIAGQDLKVAVDWQPKAVLILNWPLALRGGAELKVDGLFQNVSQRMPLEIAVEPGKHAIEITRPGTARFETAATVATRWP